jgi:hypothetical protein
MKEILPIILTVTILATTAKAGLGLSLEECVQHYGKPEYTNSDPNNPLAGNAPKAEWQKRVKDDDAFWEGFEDGSRKYSAHSYTLNNHKRRCRIVRHHSAGNRSNGS